MAQVGEELEEIEVVPKPLPTTAPAPIHEPAPARPAPAQPVRELTPA